MLKLRLSMGGTKKRPVYKIVVADSRFSRDGRFIEKLGFFNPLLPKDKKERVGLDPLADKYFKMEGKKHAMKYIKSGAEKIPFPNEYFDFVSSLNSLDHVDDLDGCIQEIKRVVKSKGKFLLIADIHSFPTVAEPSNFDWNISEKFKPEFKVELEKHFEGSNMYKSLRENVPFNHSDTSDRYGILALKLVKN